MASCGAGIVCVILVLCSAMPSLATVYTVGDSIGWVMNVDYSTWTSGKTFAVGDSLMFKYGSGHTVEEVSGSDYNTCTVGNALTTDKSGSTTIPLRTAGTHYFICGVIGHCGSGMKLAVTVSTGAGATTAPSGTPPSTTTSPAPPTTVTTPSGTVPVSSSPGTLSPPPSFEAVLITCVALFKFGKGT